MKPAEMLLARRYAKAFLNCFIDSMTIKDLQGFDLVRHCLEKNRSILFFLSLIHIDTEVKKQDMHDLFKQCNVMPEADQLVNVLLDSGRGALLSAVVKDISELYKQRKNIEFFSIATSHPVPTAQVAVIAQFLQRKLGSEIIYQHSIDPTLIAGMRLQSGTRLWEYSIAKQLNGMSDKLTS
ncbi:MAG TPA: ATP synthase F1 subunit delta [Candidatus Babeliales bacterium]|nr:ATP synthase F1 subunit delta [Candidatus Babeliales bacterium]